MKYTKKDVDQICLVASSNDLRAAQMSRKYEKKKKTGIIGGKKGTGGTGAFSGCSYRPLQMLAG